MAQIIQMTTEQLQQLIQSVRATATSGCSEPNSSNIIKSKGNFSNCCSRFGGERDHEIVEEFITSIVTYKEVEAITDEDALKSISLLFHGMASTWWQGVRKEVKSWNDALSLIRDHFSPTKPSYQIYGEIFEQKQDERKAIDTFVCQKRALLAQLPDGRHDEECEIDFIYGLLNIKYRKYIARHDIKTFKDLLERGRVIEQNIREDQVQVRHEVNSVRVPKRCTNCNYRGHTFRECRKRKNTNNASHGDPKRRANDAREEEGFYPNCM
ncbi:activity-regulated cytoskeleton associated protein 2-like [Lucilia cuprina]|uniref:activity-regulated cytoskeleton associated protein 2-like n=1 Tax=Lucilia cuprina TaxID=7375 RepID=UPI001F05700A|nr:activity-regulated cytoskeleton associated protein 2-like [Lucilia cuprina]